MGTINDIIANTSNIGNILSNVQFPPSHVNRISSGTEGPFWSFLELWVSSFSLLYREIYGDTNVQTTG